jgi:hypothetical protein
MRFRLHLKGSKLKLFDDIWQKFYALTNDEVGERQYDDSDEKNQKMQQTLTARLEELRKIVHQS